MGAQPKSGGAPFAPDFCSPHFWNRSGAYMLGSTSPSLASPKCEAPEPNKASPLAIDFLSRYQNVDRRPNYGPKAKFKIYFWLLFLPNFKLIGSGVSESQMVLSIDLRYRPYNSVHTNVLHFDDIIRWHFVCTAIINLIYGFYAERTGARIVKKSI